MKKGGIATATFDSDVHKLIYTFTKYASIKMDIKVSAIVSLNLDPHYFTKSVENEVFTINLRDISDKLVQNVQFNKPNLQQNTQMNIESMMIKTSELTKNYTYATMQHKLIPWD
ncbi:hypothetical protein K6973_04825 [Streptococcus dysgalactiae]|uniref:hypothetical protein n=1 Tax=Streptococcus dysgalactiae TaxID=1334 RepID=UPI001C9D86E4|nr:hypothetical protein [Streptococcus dysgalactiae]QZT28052.1 hypothetical protein K6973_04825 [Streptococcus dysgalactiae]